MKPFVPGTKSGASLGGITQMTSPSEAVHVQPNNHHNGTSFGHSQSSMERARQALASPNVRQYIQAESRGKLEPVTMVSSQTTIGAPQSAMTAQQH